jgi:hypothetical protein
MQRAIHENRHFVSDTLRNTKPMEAYQRIGDVIVTPKIEYDACRSILYGL